MAERSDPKNSKVHTKPINDEETLSALCVLCVFISLVTILADLTTGTSTLFTPFFMIQNLV